MVLPWPLFIVLCLVVAVVSSLLTSYLHGRGRMSTHQEHEAWQQALESRQRIWEVRQGKHILAAEKKLDDQLKEMRREWREWSIQLEQRQQTWQARAEIEQSLARLPHIEHLELPFDGVGRRLPPKNWRPPVLYQADLNGRDLSYRYLGRADLREAQLEEANFYMADLSGAALTGARLASANLTGANLSEVDLRNANLSGANFLVADLQRAVLYGADLSGARNLTLQQLQNAFYDDTTILASALLLESQNDSSSKSRHDFLTVQAEPADGFNILPDEEVTHDTVTGESPVSLASSMCMEDASALEGDIPCTSTMPQEEHPEQPPLVAPGSITDKIETLSFPDAGPGDTPTAITEKERSAPKEKKRMNREHKKRNRSKLIQLSTQAGQ